jgi:hypothetical protein
MRSLKKVQSKISWWLATIVVLSALGTTQVPVTAALSASTPVMNIVVNNNSGRDVYHLYLSPADHDAWGVDLLGETRLTTGQSFTISDASCAGAEIKVIAEDKEGCFSYGVLSCAQGSTNWTLSAETPRDCGN